MAVLFWLGLAALTFILLVAGYGSGFWHVPGRALLPLPIRCHPRFTVWRPGGAPAATAGRREPDGRLPSGRRAGDGA